MILPAIFLLGPSAVGKTSLSLELARQFPIEVISVDSAMVFKGMDIGTCKPTASEQKRVNHHLIDVIEPDQNFNAGIYLNYVEQALQDIAKKEKIPYATLQQHLSGNAGKRVKLGDGVGPKPLLSTRAKR